MEADRRVVPFRREHYGWLASNAPSAEGSLNVHLTDDLFTQLEAQNSWTCAVDGEPVMCAGTIEQWPGRHIAWAYVRRGTLPHLMWLTDEARKNLARIKGRIEFTVRKDFPAGQRWARQLGFQIETPLLAKFGPEGEDHMAFVRFN